MRGGNPGGSGGPGLVQARPGMGGYDSRGGSLMGKTNITDTRNIS